MFDDLARSVASTLSGVFGGTYLYTRTGVYALDVPLVLRKDVELLDESEQVVGRTNLVRIAHSDIAFVPERDDYFELDSKRYTLGKRFADDGYTYVFEATT